MKSRKDLPAVVPIIAAIAIVIITLLALFESDEYAKYLPMVVWISGAVGFICYLGEGEEDGRVR